MPHERQSSEINHRTRGKPTRRNYADYDEPFIMRHSAFNRGLRHHLPIRGDRIVERGLTRQYVFHRNPFDWYNSRRAIILDDFEEVLPASRLYKRFEYDEPEPYFQQESFQREPFHLRRNENHDFSNNHRHHYHQKSYREHNDRKAYNASEPEYYNNHSRHLKGNREPTSYKSATFDNREEYFDNKYDYSNKKSFRYADQDYYPRSYSKKATVEDFKYKEENRGNTREKETSSGNESVIVKDHLTNSQSNYMTFLHSSSTPKNEYQPESKSLEAQMANEFKKRYK